MVVAAAWEMCRGRGAIEFTIQELGERSDGARGFIRGTTGARVVCRRSVAHLRLTIQYHTFLTSEVALPSETVSLEGVISASEAVTLCQLPWDGGVVEKSSASCFGGKKRAKAPCMITKHQAVPTIIVLALVPGFAPPKSTVAQQPC